jgi:hypothetical protein
MEDPSPTPSTATPRRWFYGAAVLLMSAGVIVAFVQKGRESAAGTTVAKQFAADGKRTGAQRNEVRQIVRDAERWRLLSYAAVFLAMASWCAAACRHEKCRGTRVIVLSLMALYVGLELLMV